MITEVYCTLQMEGLHNWANCPHEEVAYLRDDHRHVFHIKASVEVTHTDRDVEFIMLKHSIEEYLITNYFDPIIYMCNFGSMSCEMLAVELINRFNLVQCEVNEDGENGSVVYRDAGDYQSCSNVDD